MIFTVSGENVFPCLLRVLYMCDITAWHRSPDYKKGTVEF